MTDERHSEAEAPSLIHDEVARAEREAENAIRQFDRVLDLIDDIERGGRPFRLRVSTIQELHRLALDGLSPFAGNWRPGGVRISHSKHSPPDAHLVAGLMEEMCDWVNERWAEASPVTLCSYVMWRLNWIHPFDDGNGRTSRAVAYFVLCGSVGYRFPGSLTVPEIIAKDKNPYYQVLETLDESALAGDVDLAPMKDLLESYLAQQLSSAFDDANIGRQDIGVRKLH